MIEKAIHYNRDENSFTSRLFEQMYYKFINDKIEFDKFINKINKSVKFNNDLIKNQSLHNIDIPKLTFIDLMLFMENLDLYGFCRDNLITIEIEKSEIDKTEFDVMFVCSDSDKKRVVIVFEVKCFTDLIYNELIRQNNLLNKYKSRLFDDYYHIALISSENLDNGTMIKKGLFNNLYNFGIITWNDIRCYIDEKRFYYNIEFSKLTKTVHLDGTKDTKRKLIKDI